jgi:hypothetical protein
MTTRSLAAPLLLLSCLAVGCGEPTPQPPAATSGAPTAPASTAAPPPTAPPSATAIPSGTARATASPNGAFVRHPPHSSNSDADAVDECTQHGGNYFSCRGAYFNEQDPVLKRYLYRIAQGSAAGESGYAHKGPPDTDLPHAEVPYMCDPAKKCGATNDHGEQNHAESCLARALADQMANRPAAARAAHAHACKCEPKEASFPGYNGTPFICDERGRPAFIAPKMEKDEAADILDCAICEPRRGAAACQREIERLKRSDPPLATHIETKQIKRCQTPNEGPREWDQY